MKQRVRTALAVAAWLLVASLVGCASNTTAESTLPQMWQDLFDMAFADSKLSDLQREILSDYEVTDAEYQEAVQAFVTCLGDHGWVVEVLSDGYRVSPAPGSGNDDKNVSDELYFQCQDASISYVEAIYLGMRDNPEGISWAEDVRSCFEAHDVPDGAGLSEDEFADMVTDPDFHASTPEGKLCYHDPTGSQGLTLEEAERMDALPRVGFTLDPNGSIDCGPDCTVSVSP